MRFTTWPTVTNVFIVSAVALLPLIPVANAQGTVTKLAFVVPELGDTYQAGENANVNWTLTWIGAPSENDAGEGLILMKNTHSGYSHILAEGVHVLDSTTLPVTYPDDAPPSEDYYLSFQTKFGIFYSDLFNMAAD